MDQIDQSIGQPDNETRTMQASPTREAYSAQRRRYQPPAAAPHRPRATAYGVGSGPDVYDGS